MGIFSRGTTVQVSAKELQTELSGANPPVVLDVREPDEVACGCLEGVRCIPLGSLPGRLGELDPDADLVVMCASGGRSAQAVRFLQAHGFKHVRDLCGGIGAWVRDGGRVVRP